MTTLMWFGRSVYADSKMTKGDESFQSMTKINGLAKPMTFVSTKNKITDRVFGWYCSGATMCGHAVLEFLQGDDANADTAITVLATAERFNLANYENFFELILVGEKANYSLGWAPGGPRLEIYPHDTPFVLGSGKSTLLALLNEHPDIDPLRAMFATFYRDNLSGGMVEVWRLEPKTESSDTVFHRVGICNDRTREEIAPLLSDLSAPMGMDFVKVTDRVNAVLAFLEKKDADKEAEEKSKQQARTARKARKAAKSSTTPVVKPRKKKA